VLATSTGYWRRQRAPFRYQALVEALLASYPQAQIERRWTRPADAGVRAIGHHGFFSERHRDSLWRGALDWIDARCT
jgi:predicted alpha/beta hydrolase